DHPFTTIAQALSTILPGDTATIALSLGTHAAPAILPSGITLRGACADGTELTASAATMSIASGRKMGAIAALTLIGPNANMAAVSIDRGAALSMDSVVLPSGGIHVSSGAALSLTSGSIAGAIGAAIAANDGARVRLLKTEIASTFGSAIA